MSILRDVQMRTIDDGLSVEQLSTPVNQDLLCGCVVGVVELGAFTAGQRASTALTSLIAITGLAVREPGQAGDLRGAVLDVAVPVAARPRVRPVFR